MPITARRITRSIVVGASVLAVASLTAATAGADSGQVEYLCEFQVEDNGLGGGTEGEGIATGSFDTAIPDGLVIDLGDSVSAGPFTGVMTLPDAFTDLLRAAGVTTIQGGEHADVYWVPGQRGQSWLSLDDTAVPAEGSMSVSLQLFGEWPLLPASPGTYTIVIGFLTLLIQDQDAGTDIAQMSCDPVDGENVVVIDGSTVVAVDTFEVVGPAAPTTPVATRAGSDPVRPVLVQTDFAEDEGGIAPLLGVGALMTLGAGAVGLARGRKRATSRRH